MKPNQRRFHTALPTVLKDPQNFYEGEAHAHYPMKKLKQKATFTRKTYTQELMEQLEADQRLKDSRKQETDIHRKTLQMSRGEKLIAAAKIEAEVNPRLNTDDRKIRRVTMDAGAKV